MRQVELENTLYSILYGTYYFKHYGMTYRCLPNSLQDKYEASLIYEQVINDIRYEDMLTWDQAQKISEMTGKWTVKDEAGLNDLNKMVSRSGMRTCYPGGS